MSRSFGGKQGKNREKSPKSPRAAVTPEHRQGTGSPDEWEGSAGDFLDLPETSGRA
jgi:hypothetical protein